VDAEQMAPRRCVAAIEHLLQGDEVGFGLVHGAQATAGRRGYVFFGAVPKTWSQNGALTP
jgi:hypothetical protein